VLLISILSGFAIALLGERGQPIAAAIDMGARVFFGIIRIVVQVAPIGAFGAMAFTIGAYGLDSLWNCLRWSPPSISPASCSCSSCSARSRASPRCSHPSHRLRHEFRELVPSTIRLVLNHGDEAQDLRPGEARDRAEHDEHEQDAGEIEGGDQRKQVPQRVRGRRLRS